MRRDTGDKRVKKGLFPAFVKTREKCLVLFFALILSFSFVNIVRAEWVPIPDEQLGKTITVQAVVPLTPEFVFSIKKNSSVTLEKSAFALGEEINVRVKIMGGNSFPLRSHKINLQVLNARESAASNEKILFVLSGETDNDGIAYFSFSADERLLGENTLRVVDVTYDEQVVTSQEKVFIVYKPSDGKKERELSEQKIIIRRPVVSEQILFDKIGRFFADGGTLQNNDTIIAYIETQSPNRWSNDP